MITHYGTFDFIELPDAMEFTPVGGLVTTRRIKLLKTSVTAYLATLAANGYSWTMQPDDGSPYAVVTTITKPGVQVSWTLDGNDIDLPIWQLPKVSAMLELTGSNYKARAAFRADIERFVRGEYTNDEKTELGTIKSLFKAAIMQEQGRDPYAPPKPEVSGFVDQITDALVSALIEGTEAFASSSFVLRKTAVYPPTTNVSIEFLNVGKLFTLQSLVATEPSIPVNFSDKLTELRGYWQKKSPSSTQGADGQFTDTVEYWWSRDFNSFLYEVIQ